MIIVYIILGIILAPVFCFVVAAAIGLLSEFIKLMWDIFFIAIKTLVQTIKKAV